MKDKENNSSEPFYQLLAVSAASKLADLLMSAKTTLPWILQSLGAPTWMSSALVPIRESGSLLPQWWINQTTRNVSQRVKLWRIGVTIQALCIGSMALAAYWLEGSTAGWMILTLLALMSLGRALSSLTMKDIKGGLISKGRRGKLVGWASSISGGLSILTAFLLLLGQENLGQLSLTLLLAGSALLYGLSGLASAGLSLTLAGNREDERNQLNILTALKSHAALRHLIINRVLMLHTALVAPYFVIFSQQQHDNFDLPFFMIATAVAALISSWLWGALADRSARWTLRVAGTLAAAVSIVFYLTLSLQINMLYIALFFLLSVAHAGVRTGRKTYLLDIAEGNQRTLFTATANTCVGALLLVSGLTYSVISNWLSEAVVPLMALFMLAAVLHSFWLPAEK